MYYFEAFHLVHTVYFTILLITSLRQIGYKWTCLLLIVPHNFWMSVRAIDSMEFGPVSQSPRLHLMRISI